MAETYAQAAPGIIGGFSFIVFLVNRKDYELFFSRVNIKPQELIYA
jgi:hypothetical protein